MRDTFKNPIHCRTLEKGSYLHELRVRSHKLRADVGTEAGGADSAPDPHDYFDSALAFCKAQTAIWYARRHDIPLEYVETTVERDNSEERRGKYRLRVHLDFQGPLSDEQRATLEQIVAACPIHKLMTRVDVDIRTRATVRG
jgi:putative redox protein